MSDSHINEQDNLGNKNDLSPPCPIDYVPVTPQWTEYHPLLCSGFLLIMDILMYLSTINMRVSNMQEPWWLKGKLVVFQVRNRAITAVIILDPGRNSALSSKWYDTRFFYKKLSTPL